MVTLAGYQDFIQIHHSENSQVYRARREKDNQPVILKFLNRDYPSPEQIRRYKQEYHLTQQLDFPGIIKAYSLEEWQRSYTIVLEDFDGISLRKWLQEREKISLEEFLEIAIATTESLSHIHANNIIHKDINPANIVFNAETKELKIIDFGISTQLSRENPILKNPNVLEGTLAYISPEQTGRMNRGLDYRTDFYSLGVTLYEILTDKLPFIAEDALELVHCHIAKLPQFKIKNSQFKIPSILEKLVLKLMAKNAEDRYQSANGLKADLENCQQQFRETGAIAPFRLGQQDISERFQIPQKLYGRETEVPHLIAVFDRVIARATVELLLVAGYSGIGKSSLVQELFKPITAYRGFFIAGKFDQYQRNIPYSALVAAFKGLIDQLLGETEERLQIWREKLLHALEENGQIIIDVIPELEGILGKQPPVTVLEASEAQNRFNLVFGKFINVFCSEKHPLTIFIDDLQWADLATLQLMERLLSEEQNQYLLLLGAYRDNEVPPGHPLLLTLDKVRQKTEEKISQITLKTLTLEQITDLMGDALAREPETTEDLAGLVLQKTGGNPFFINEFLQALHEENLLQFDRASRSWQWEIAEIEARNFTDNVVELMVSQLQKLPPASQEMLSLAACWGAEFDLELLAWVRKESYEETFAGLKIPLDRGFILPRSELDEHLLIRTYKFGHDRIQQAAYALIPDAEKAPIHYRIGTVLWQELDPETRNERIFELVGQLNYGIDAIADIEKRDEWAQLNLAACRKAKDATAYQAGREYARLGLTWLGEKAWERQYETTLIFHELAVELAFIWGDVEEMERFIDMARAQAASVLELVNIYHTRILDRISRQQATQGIAIAREFLEQLGCAFPETPTDEDTQQAIDEVVQLMGSREVKDLIDLPMMTDREKIAIVRIATSIMPAAYVSGSPLLPLLSALSVKLSLQYGNTLASSLGYIWYAHLICNFSNDPDIGVEFGQLAIRYTSRPDAKAFRAEPLNQGGFVILHRKFHLKETLPILQEGHAIALDVGNLLYVGYTSVNIATNSFFCGRNLHALEMELRTFCHRLTQLNQFTNINYLSVFWQSVLNLLGQGAKHPSILTGEAIQENEFLPQLVEINDIYGVFLFHLYKFMLSYLFGELEWAREQERETRKYLVAGIGMIGEPIFYFYNSLTILATLDLGEGDRALELQKVAENQTKLKQCWARYAPMNHQHKVDLVEAEICRVWGRKADAIELYDRAIAGAKANEFIQEEALANELAAKFYLDWEKEKIARSYMMDAHYCYTRWGATAKVSQLEENYPDWCQVPSQQSSSNILNTQSTSNSTGGADLDLATVIKSTNTISSEIELETLLATLMKILVENAGARRGILILPHGDDLLVEATKEVSESLGKDREKAKEQELAEISVLQALPLDEFEKVASKIVRYVARTGETVVLNNASREGKFMEDAYIQACQCQSIACVPFINQGKLQGIIYLENNLTTSAFTQERMALLRTLATQAAISLENARFYDACKRFVPEGFLSLLDKNSIVEVKLGDRIEREMTILFSDIRSFTTMSEKMTPEENFGFINGYLGQMEPLIEQYGGFIDKYIGDAIMALFPTSADDAVKGSLAMLEELKRYNQFRQENNQPQINIGIGLHTGKLMLGMVGGTGRMDGTAIGDAVNLSSRVEGLTKTYGAALLITYQTWKNLKNPNDYDFRFLDKVKAKGKTEAVGLLEVFSADRPDLKEAKIATKTKFEQAVLFYHSGSFQSAANLFQECLSYHGGDRAARAYVDRCRVRMNN